MAPRRPSFSFGAPSTRWTMYWSVHQYQRPMTGAQMAIPSQGNASLKYQACLTRVPAESRSTTGAQVLIDARRREGLPEVEHLRAAERLEVVPAAQLVEAVEGQQGGAADQDRHLNRVVVRHGAHAAESRVEAREQDDDDGADPEAIDEVPANRELHLRHQRGEDDAAGEDADGDLGDDEGDQRDDGEHVAGAFREALLEELRHRVDQRARVEGDEDPGQDQQAPGVKLVVGQRDTVTGARSGQADDVLGADVGGEDGRANDPPAEVATGQEVIGRFIFAGFDDPPDHRAEDAEVRGNRDPVQRLQGASHGRALVPHHPDVLSRVHPRSGWRGPVTASATDGHGARSVSVAPVDCKGP